MASGTIEKYTRVAVCSRSFSRNSELRAELESRYDKVTFNDGGLVLEGETLVSFLKGHSKVIVGLEQINKSILDQLPEVEVISKYGVGLDKLDLDYMREREVRLGWTPGVNKRSVSELVIAFSIAMLRHVYHTNKDILAGEWKQLPGGLLSGRTFGIIGCGNVGKDLVPLLKAFGCRIIVNDIQDYRAFYQDHNIMAVDLETLLTTSDLVSLHVPLDETTKNMLGEKSLAMMKSSAILINLARGGLVNERYLKEMLKSGKLAGAAFDVFSTEPPEDMELLNLPNFLSTPHIGGSAQEAIIAMGKAAIDGLVINHLPS
jgi:phosphoglycerate dehydrogenase-like enzyme